MARKNTSSKRGAVVKPEAHSVVETKNDPKEGEHIDRVKRLIRAQGDSLLSLPNVTSIGIGFKRVGGVTSKTVSLQLSVDRKIAPEILAAEAVPSIPKSISFEGVEIPTDVVQRSFKPSYIVLEIERKSERKSRQDPIIGGFSIGHFKSTAGTIGAIVLESKSRSPVILSNWHVLSGARGRVGDAIVQPGPHDDNQVEKNHVGALLRSHLGLAGDCAIASIENRKASSDIFEIAAKLDSIGKPELGDLVVRAVAQLA